MSAPRRGRAASRPSASTRASSPAAARPRVAKATPGPARRSGARTAPKQSILSAQRPLSGQAGPQLGNPWRALWAMMIGFFMILVDSTIVAVANPKIMEQLATDYDGVIWVTSAYLLAYAVPLLVAGRLGDQFGPKNLYLIGLSVFTAASLWCGLSGSIETLIAARVLQGIGAALLTPQTLSTITRIFPADRRGVAMSVWGATAGVATLVGPLAGGVLVDHLGWEWIFFVNVPIGIVGVILGIWLIPVLPTHRHRFDIPGVLLSGAAMFLVVFALQEGESHSWPLWIWAMIAAGIALMAVFLYWQSVNKHEPLIPLRIFADRDFSLANVAVAVIGFAVTAMIVPVMFYAQVVCGLTPTRAALLTAPMAIISGVLAPLVGRIIDRTHPRSVIGFGFSVLAIGLTWLSWEMTPAAPVWRLVLPFLALGVGMAFIWAPLAATATRNLPPQLAGAGSGVYNATRQLGSVLGSAGIAAFMTSRIAAEMPGGQSRPPGAQGATQLPEFLREPFASALSQSMLLPAFIALFGVIAALFMVGMVRPAPQRVTFFGSGAAAAASAPAPLGPAAPPSADAVDKDSARANAPTQVIPLLPDPFSDLHRGHPHGLSSHPEGYIDDEGSEIEYVITLAVSPDVIKRPAPVPAAAEYDEADDRFVAPIAAAGELVAEQSPELPEPVAQWFPDDELPSAEWHPEQVHADVPALAEHPVQPPEVEPIGFAHNGFHVDDKQHWQPTPPPTVAAGHRPADSFEQLASRIDDLTASITELFDRHDDWLPRDRTPSGGGAHRSGGEHELRSRHSRPESNEVTDGPARHYRDEPDETTGTGRHAHP